MVATTHSQDRRLWISVLAVVASAALLAAVLAPRLFPGENPSVRVAEHAVGGPSPLGPACTHYPGAQATMDAPAAGTVVVSANVGVGIGHEFGTPDVAWVVVAESPTACALNNYTAFVTVPASLPTDANHYETVSVLRPFDIPAAGRFTFYVNGLMEVGYNLGDRFDSASLVATYYPR